jgi:hypothetical protein
VIRAVEEFRNLSGMGVKGKVGEAFCALGLREVPERSPLQVIMDKIEPPSSTLT